MVTVLCKCMLSIFLVFSSLRNVSFPLSINPLRTNQEFYAASSMICFSHRFSVDYPNSLLSNLDIKGYFLLWKDDWHPVTNEPQEHGSNHVVTERCRPVTPLPQWLTTEIQVALAVQVHLQHSQPPMTWHSLIKIFSHTVIFFFWETHKMTVLYPVPSGLNVDVWNIHGMGICSQLSRTQQLQSN